MTDEEQWEGMSDFLAYDEDTVRDIFISHAEFYIDELNQAMLKKYDREVQGSHQDSTIKYRKWAINNGGYNRGREFGGGEDAGIAAGVTSISPYGVLSGETRESFAKSFMVGMHISP